MHGSCMMVETIHTDDDRPAKEVHCYKPGIPFMLGSFQARLCKRHQATQARQWFPSGRVPVAIEAGGDAK